MAEFLAVHGRPVLARNFRTPFGEIDLVALDGDTVCVIEVRARASGARVSAIETVDRGKRRRVERAAQAFLARRRLDGRPIRFDVAAVTEEEIDYVEGAW